VANLFQLAEMKSKSKNGDIRNKISSEKENDCIMLLWLLEEEL
jgi:hypothetical protein